MYNKPYFVYIFLKTYPDPLKIKLEYMIVKNQLHYCYKTMLYIQSID